MYCSCPKSRTHRRPRWGAGQLLASLRGLHPGHYVDPQNGLTVDQEDVATDGSWLLREGGRLRIAAGSFADGPFTDLTFKALFDEVLPLMLKAERYEEIVELAPAPVVWKALIANAKKLKRDKIVKSLMGRSREAASEGK